jgi:hypothetical protein
MNYDLAKGLNDAGFPQAGNGKWIGSPSEIVWRSGDRVYVPTLEELIAACGDEIEALTHEHSHAGNEWVASSFNATASPTRHARAATPIEAVAGLWLALYANPGPTA